MTIATDAGQLIWAGFEGAAPPDELLGRIRAEEVGGVILFARNLGSLGETGALLRALHAAAPTGLPLLASVDQEGGRVARLKAPFLQLPPMARLGATGDAALARSVGRALGEELRWLGFNCDYTPVLDVHTNPQNPVIGDRSFATTPEEVARMGAALLAGLEETGVVGCGKHFPGHGDTELDSHLALPRVTHPEERLRRIELFPFAAAVRAGCRLVMTAHVIFDALDPGTPATLSSRILEGVLRRELGFAGVCVSDDLEMKAIADHFGVEDAAVRAVRAGCDALLCCKELELQHRAFAALVREAERDAAFRARLGEAAGRVRGLRRTLPLPSPAAPAEVQARFPFAGHAWIAERLGAP